MKCKRAMIALSAVTALICVSAAIFAIASSMPDYSNAALTFSGMRLVKQGSTTQGFIDISLSNINTAGVSFCMEYDKDYIELSKVSDNEPVKNPAPQSGVPSVNPNAFSFDVKHEYFRQDTEMFPLNSFRDNTDAAIYSPHPMIIGTADPNNGRVLMTFVPSKDSEDLSDYIDNEILDSETHIYGQPVITAANAPQGVHFGEISFNIKDPVAFSRLTQDQLKNIIKIIPFSDMVDLGGGTGSEDDDEYGLQMAYYDYSAVEPDDDQPPLEWYPCRARNVKYNLDINLALEDVKPQIDELTVSAYDIYKNGDSSDLISFLNANMPMVTLEYADGSQVPAVFEWTSDASINPSWDPKGGVYTVTQKYNDNFNITVKVNVTPVRLTGLEVENKSKTYFIGSPDMPKTYEALQLPKTARAVFDTYIPNGGIPELILKAFDPSTLPSDFGTQAETYTFNGGLSQVSEMSLQTHYRWLTYSDVPKITVTRTVVESEDDMPKTLEVVSAVTSDDGVMTITVKNSDDSNIPEGTEFEIKLPVGSPLTVKNGGRYTVRADNTATAEITLDPQMSAADEQQLACMVNLGSRAGTFKIASTEPDKSQGEFADFVPNPRNNYYLPYSDAVKDYEFDYSAELSAMFPVQAGSLPPTTVTLLRTEDGIKTTYDGLYGTEQGRLVTFTVDSWTKTADSGDETQPGDIVEIEGVLSDTSYTNYGEVKNKPEPDQIKVKIKYYVTPNDNADTIERIDDFVFDTKQVGYDYDELQTKTFTVKNTGKTDISGLSAVIELSRVDDGDETKEAFLLTRVPIGLLPQGETADFDITTKYGLPVGKYVSKVTIYSDNKELQSFNISFTVTAEKVYKITLKANDPNLGKAETATKTYTAKENDVISITATPETDCIFEQWSVNPVSDDDKTSNTTTFTMPPNDVEIIAYFKETTAAQLRATELIVKDTAENGGNSYPLNKEDWTQIEFDPITRTYYVAVPNDREEVELWFKPRKESTDEGTQITKTLSVAHDPDDFYSASPTLTKDNDDEYYKSEPISIEACKPGSKVDNVLTLTLSAGDGESNNRSYTIHIFRKLSATELIDFNYGNSPYGLIMSDALIADKDAAKQSFIDNGRKFTPENVPANGETEVTYTENAWKDKDFEGVDYDLSETALFVTDYTSFKDPGYNAIYNSLGDAQSTVVTREASVDVLTETNASKRNGTADDFRNISSEPEKVTISPSDTVTEFADKRIRPDIYRMIYSFTDFDGATVSVSRPLIILSPLGDVNISKQLSEDDALSVVNRFSAPLADNNSVGNYQAGGLLNRYRICDANKDGYINAVDANNIRAGTTKPPTPFYKNLP